MTQINVRQVSGWYEPLARLAKQMPEPELFKKISRMTDHFWLVWDDEPLMFVGGIRSSLVGNDLYLWAIAFRGLKPRHLRGMKAAFEKEARAFRRVWVQADRGQNDSIRFARFFGMEKVAELPGTEFFGRAA